MSYFPATMVRRSQQTTGVVGFTGAAPQVVNGTGLQLNQVMSGTLAARVYTKATVNTLTLTGKWQVLDDDNVTWIDAVNATNPASVASVTGTGAAVTATKLYEAPQAVYGRIQVRFVVTSGVGVGGGAGSDECSIAYDFRLPYFI